MSDIMESQNIFELMNKKENITEIFRYIKDYSEEDISPLVHKVTLIFEELRINIL